MKRVIIAVTILLLTFSIAFAAGPKTYQVTGPVLEVKDDSIIVQKGKEKWQIARDKDTKIKGDLKVGAKVMIEYTMKAVAVEVKGEPKKLQPKNK
jgi:cytochrome c1